ITFGNIGKGLSPFPYVLSLPQDVHERIVIRYLQTKNIEVEWNRELLHYEETAGSVKAVISDGDEIETLEYSYLCGCDGPGSSVRKQMGFDFPGGTYEEVFFVADVMSDSEAGGVQVHMSKEGFALVLPVRTSGSLRIIGLVPDQIAQRKEDARYGDVSDYVENPVGI